MRISLCLVLFFTIARTEDNSSYYGKALSACMADKGITEEVYMKTDDTKSLCLTLCAYEKLGSIKDGVFAPQKITENLLDDRIGSEDREEVMNLVNICIEAAKNIEKLCDKADSVEDCILNHGNKYYTEEEDNTNLSKEEQRSTSTARPSSTTQKLTLTARAAPVAEKLTTTMRNSNVKNPISKVILT
uniref:Odorant-binding protein 21 n=1 Tax=Trichogramma dendrolimi TaxID=114056 RepID=A0A2S0BE16_9HYME|nr:odorant-binding protein 21 [Trichogramma dendrolimi]